ncbi:MAG: tRNA (guanosine(37)-N1)-methyltransferase TrmD [Clostridiales bacterium]|nr:tRNA (guanosine(37)-N1)-methyltransferase TrmD [Clostridiales bacterium]
MSEEITYRYRVDIITLFPETTGDVLSESILGRAQERDYLKIECHQLRDYTTNKQNQVDDYPYGGGHGAILQADPLYRCWKHICDSTGERAHTIFMSPCGVTFTQAEAKRLVRDYNHLILVCGHYEGIDQRFIDECVDEELSLGDFVLTGGEIAAMAVTDAVCRMVPGVLSDPECYENESHWDNLLEYPQYSRPEVWHDRAVPKILLSGHHANIAKWRRKMSLVRTKERRPDLYERLDLSSKADQKLLKEIDEDKWE